MDRNVNEPKTVIAFKSHIPAEMTTSHSYIDDITFS